ncbi:MAG: hypothetical protein OSA48_01575, partial [Akkermansiaceae bacterium]|nr:hypothetical protein [Akkermansiaceae bacterium]
LQGRDGPPGRPAVQSRMARPVLYETPGARYHIIARGNGGKMAYDTDADRHDDCKRRPSPRV